MRRRLALGFGMAQAQAQDKYPSKVVEIIVPFTAGGLLPAIQ